MSDLRAVLAGTGIAVPPHEVDNHRLSKILDTSDQWIQERSGIVTRYYVDAGVGSSELGIEASRAALADAGLEPSEVDYIVCATMTPDHYFPGSGTLIQHGLGIGPVPALDIRQQCAGFAYGLQISDALIRSGSAGTVLLVGCDVHSSLFPVNERSWEVLFDDGEETLDEESFAYNSQFRHLLVLFGDAAGAMVFQAGNGDSDDRGILGSKLYGDGNHKDILYVPGVGSARRPFIDAAALEACQQIPVMDGRAVFKLAATRMPEASRDLLAEHDYSVDDVDLVVMHQANLRINDAAQKVMGLPDSKVHNNIQRYGNTTSATLPLCFHEARQAGKAADGSLVVLTALGAGLHWGSVLMRV